jgi:ABC-type oligopeptide transport system substrate-binding subunit
MYREVDDIVTRQDYAVLPLFYPKHQFAAKDYVEGAKVGNLIYHVRGVDIDVSKEDYLTG